MQQNPRKRQPLFLSTGQGLIPRRIFLDAVNEMRKPDFLQRVGNFLNVPVLRRARVGDRAPQRAARNVRPLWQQDEP